MLNPASPLSRLLDAPVRPGRVTWIGLRPARQAALVSVASVLADPDHGLDGDRYTAPNGRRQVTLIGEEDLAAIASFLGLPSVAPDRLRRNLVVRGLNLLATKERRLRIGTVLLDITGECHPCSRMEATFGPGGYNAVRGHGGVTARVVEAGTITIGNTVERLVEIAS